MRPLLLCCSLLFLATSFAHTTLATWTFGMSISPSTDGQLFSLFLVKVHEGKVLETRPLGREQFVKQAQGRMNSEANPTKEDLFAKFDIKACYLPPDSVAMGYSVRDCSVLDNLWKIRYWEYPQQGPDGPRTVQGWAAKPLKPSDRQLGILGAYGIRLVNDMVLGDAIFRLLHDMSDPNWVNNYRQG